MFWKRKREKEMQAIENLPVPPVQQPEPHPLVETILKNKSTFIALKEDLQNEQRIPWSFDTKRGLFLAGKKPQIIVSYAKSALDSKLWIEEEGICKDEIARSELIKMDHYLDFVEELNRVFADDIKKYIDFIITQIEEELNNMPAEKAV